jgi:hypothetical protein
MGNDPNEITITEGNKSVQLTLRAHSPKIARTGDGDFVASTRVMIVAKAADARQMHEIRHLLIGANGRLNESVLGQLSDRLNNHYLSKDIDNQYKSSLAPLFRGMDRLFSAIGNRRVVKLLVYPQREEDTLIFDVELNPIPDKADSAKFTRDVRHALRHLKTEREEVDPTKRVR